MKGARKVVVPVLLVIVATPVIFAAAMYAYAWHSARQAHRLLDAVRNCKPGLTSEAEYLKAVGPVASSASIVYDDKQQPIGLGFANRPAWTETLPHAVIDMVDERLIAPVVVFDVVPQFADGRLTKLHIQEISAEIGGHPPGASVTLFTRTGYDSEFPFRDNAGYRVEHEVEHTFVFLDDRATPPEVKQAFDFSFSCFTKMQLCDETEEFLHPAPSRQEVR